MATQTPLTKEQVKTKIRLCIGEGPDTIGELQDLLMVNVIIPMLSSHGQTPPYKLSPEMSELFNSSMADVMEELDELEMGKIVPS